MPRKKATNGFNEVVQQTLVFVGFSIKINRIIGHTLIMNCTIKINESLSHFIMKIREAL